MAHESATADFGSLETTTTCEGCGIKLNLLENHVLLTVKVVRQVIETVDAALVGAEVNESGEIVALAEVDTDEDSDNSRYYIGTRSGATDHVTVHNGECAAIYLQTHSILKAEKPKLKLLHTDDHAEARDAE